MSEVGKFLGIWAVLLISVGLAVAIGILMAMGLRDLPMWAVVTICAVLFTFFVALSIWVKGGQ